MQEAIHRTQLGGEEIIGHLGRSGWYAAGAAVCILNAAIGTVFAGEFFGVFGQGMLMPAEGIAAGVIAADILIFVNLLVKRKIDGDL